MGGSGMSLSLMVNGIAYTADVEPETPLLWVLRDLLKLTGTKFGCGIAQCGACTVHVDGAPLRSCMLPISALEGRAVTGRKFLPMWHLCPHPRCDQIRRQVGLGSAPCPFSTDWPPIKPRRNRP